jgi:hypothetical protein
MDWKLPQPQRTRAPTIVVRNSIASLLVDQLNFERVAILHEHHGHECKVVTVQDVLQRSAGVKHRLILWFRRNRHRRYTEG